MISKKFILPFLTCLFFVSASSQTFAQEDAVKERKAQMRANNKAVKAIAAAVKQNDFTAIEENAKLIIADMNKMLDLFPKGSTAKDSRAKAEIWDNWDSFTEKALAAKTAAEELAKAASAKDSEQVGAKIKALGTSGSGACGSCHRTFRARSKRNR